MAILTKKLNKVLIKFCTECTSFQREDEHGCDNVCHAESRLILTDCLLSDTNIPIPDWCPKLKNNDQKFTANKSS